ncbi:UDPglucose--hexose-1-phosphate uridylyltransferase [Jatrophihabitans endophyticus]|uniref:Galactose-1-phosphate uridylyltransferase n=1 Tax=Jatrophihabitans endophyticus TaxID=1206085 RepID=A0A1M5PBW3_9ACTN|nr:galactose-1-phosphate uridylyltransferase [Jatrophihabitans endophyticus]SHG99177.1 UDPglucose--hexose-1-phosphate uridylyltransferase [Jatrophihabitans endophyticus]
MSALRSARKTATRLSDGRELIYFDESAGAGRGTPDTRGLDPIQVSSELRRDPLTDEWIVVASHRQTRTYQPATAACPLCPTTSRDNLSEVPVPGYDVVVFENRFPSLTADAAGSHDDDPVFARRPGVGRCEVVCFSDDHDASFASLPPARARTIVDVWADRTAALSAVPGVEHVFPFENRGREIGVTLSHPHGQIYAYPFVAPRWARMLETAARHRERTGVNLFAEVLAAEQEAGLRVVARTEHWTAFVPAAARWPVELHLYPNRHVRDLTELDDAERDDFAVTYLDMLRRLDALYDAPLPYIAAWYQAPVRQHRNDAYLHLQLLSTKRAPDKLKFLAGSESAMGVFINDVVPEDMAARLRSG